jgi:hypothetical protein
MRKDAPLSVDVPSADRDSPAWVKVGVIAAVGFVIGVAWPRLVGVKLGPSAPGETASAAAAAGSARASAKPDAPPASVSAKTPVQPSAAVSAPMASASAAPPAPPNVNVLKGSIIACKTDDGDSKKGKDCGAVPSLDQVVVPRLRKVAQCSGAEGQTGKLSFVANADFASGRFSWDIGKSSTVGNIDQLTTCLKTHFQGVTLQGAAHENPRYTVAYTAVFTLPKEEAAKDEPAASANAKTPSADTPKADQPSGSPLAAPAGGEATVAWEVALVRDVPKTGQVVARLPRGSKVKLGSVKEGWYAIKYGDGFSSDGWVYRGAIGR